MYCPAGAIDPVWKSAEVKSRLFQSQKWSYSIQVREPNAISNTVGAEEVDLFSTKEFEARQGEENFLLSHASATPTDVIKVEVPMMKKSQRKVIDHVKEKLKTPFSLSLSMKENQI